MSLAIKDKSHVWTEDSLGCKIHFIKENKDVPGLIQFLEIRLADESPCCVKNRPRFWNELGMCRINQENFELAETCFENALQITPDYDAAQYNLATFAMEAGDLLKAIRLYDHLLANHPDHFNALFNAGICHSQNEQKKNAISMFVKAATLKPDHGHVQFLTGETLLQAGRAVEALPYFEKAHTLNHGHFESTQGFAISLLESGNFKQALIICDQALLTHGPAMLPLQIKGDALLALNRIEEAVQCHIDLINLDLDVRDFLVTRIKTMAEKEPDIHKKYIAIVMDKYREYKTVLGAGLKNNETINKGIFLKTS